jgi:hypothetical protein
MFLVWTFYLKKHFRHDYKSPIFLIIGDRFGKYWRKARVCLNVKTDINIG